MNRYRFIKVRKLIILLVLLMSAGCNSESNSHSLSQDTVSVSVSAPAPSKSDIDFAALSNDSIKKMMNDAKKMVDEANAKFDSSNKFDHEITDQNIYKTAHTFIGKTKKEIISKMGTNYDLTNEGQFLYTIGKGEGNQPTYIEYNFIDENCLGVVLFFNSTQLNSVKQYLTRTFLLQEVKIPDTELYTKLWIEKEINGRYTWSLTEKEEFFFVSLLFYK